MTTQDGSTPKAIFLPVLVTLIALCLGAAAALTLLTSNAAAPAGPAELSLVAQRLPYEAQNALRGEASAFDALAKSSARLKSLRAAAGNAGAGNAANAAAWNKLSDGVRAVSEARTAVETIQA